MLTSIEIIKWGCDKMIPGILVKYTPIHKDVPEIDLTLNDESGIYNDIMQLLDKRITKLRDYVISVC